MRHQLLYSIGVLVVMTTMQQARAASVDNSKLALINNATSISKTATDWRPSNYSQCSVTCGTGVETSAFHCYDSSSTRTVADRFCRHTTKPATRSRSCVRPPCGFVWIVGTWQQCSAPCGGGVQHRVVYCVDELADGSVQPSASNNTCLGPKPDEATACNEQRCPSVWFTGKWSECVVPCGGASAYQLRAVACSDDVIGNCSESDRPRSWRVCQTTSVTSPCYQVYDNESSALHKVEFEPPPPGVGEVPQSEDNFDVGSGESLILGLRGSSSDESKEISSEPSFMVSSWGPCSATCGVAVRTRRVQCRAFVESLMSVQDLQDSSCGGVKPDETEYCSLPECSDALGQETYSWSFNGFGPCSKSCASGTQDPVFVCVRRSDFTTVKADKCSRVSPPGVERRTCNRQACPARWRAFPNGPCSAPCGGGQQRLLVQCVREAAPSASSPDSGSLFDDDVVADEFCNATSAPARTILCNLAPCAPTWSIDSWSECSSSCGDGVQMRQVRCVQKISPYNIATVDDSFCRGVASPDYPLGTSQLRPESERVCNLGDCPADRDVTSGQHQRSSVIITDPTIFTQLVPSTKVSLVVGGTATLIPGLTINVHCPVVRNFSRQKIVWRRPDEVLITARGRIKVSSPGSIRIRKSRPADAGLYTCVAGQDSASVEIMFHSEDEALSLMIAQSQMTTTDENKDYNDDISEEQVQYDGDPELPADPHDARRRLNGANPDSVPLAFVPGPWSECSRTCGGAGIHSRQVTCEIRGAVNYRLIVDDSYCDRRQISRPVEQRDCGFTMCPTWQTGPWSECTSDSCAGIGIGTRQRPTFCVGFHGVLLNSTQCAPEAKPEDREPCPHISGCHTIWVPSNWSKCSVSCGGRGVRSRRLHCIWMSNKHIADSQHCEHLPNRPPTSKSCFAPPCMDAGCRDESKYCSLIPTLHMCRYPQYRRECCHSCSRHGSVTSPSSSSSTMPSPAPHTSRRGNVQ